MSFGVIVENLWNDEQCIKSLGQLMSVLDTECPLC